MILALAFVVGIAFAAYAEVQNVKVGGEVTVMGVSRNGFALTETATQTSSNILAHIAKVKIDADLTDAVAATLLLRNEAIWGTTARTTTGDNDVDVAAAYVTLKNFLHEKATLKLGKMPVRLGSGLLIGDPDTNRVSTGTFNPGFGDLSSRKTFTGGMGMLDLSPLAITLGGLKITEGNTDINKDDVNVYIASAAYDTGVKNTTVELYDILKDATKGEVNNVGARLVSAPIENLAVSGEYVYQSSKAVSRENTESADDAGLLLTANYGFPKVMWTPNLGLIYLRVSDNWDSMYEDLTAGDIINAILPLTDCQVIGASVTAKPMEDLTAKLAYTNARLLTAVSDAALPVWYSDTAGTYYNMTDKKDLGNEIDLNLTYAYTEDVQLGLALGYYMPGKAFDKNANRDDASQVIGSMKVTF
jgi:hypothetical protein